MSPRLGLIYSASAWTGISRLLKEKGREQFWPKKSNLLRTSKNLKNLPNFTTFMVNKMFSHKF
jgi:hypothetical protein